METSSRPYHREFVRSPHHAWLGILTLGLGFLSAQPFFLLLGATAYGLGWIYLPDLPFFKRWVDQRFDAAERTAALAQVAEFVRKRETLLNALAVPRRVRYNELTEVCSDIEKATTENPLAAAGPGNDPRLRKLDEEFAISDYPVRGLRAGGIRLANKELHRCQIV